MERNITDWFVIVASQDEDGKETWNVGKVSWHDSRGIGVDLPNGDIMRAVEWEHVIALGETMIDMKSPEDTFN